jgi:galactokinase/mevalonate kinase-like predicted kinase
VAHIIRCSAPGRAGIIGNPTDMYGGSVISCSIRERATVTLRPSEHLILDNGMEKCLVTSPEDLSLKGDFFDIAKAVLIGSGSTDIHAHISWTTDVPFRAGLSGSTALLVSTLAAVLAYRGIEHPPYYMAELARMIEYHHLGVFCGYQDAYMCTFGGINYMDFRDKEFHQAFGEDPYATLEPLSDLALPITLIITGGQRVSGTVHTPLRERWGAGERAVVDAYHTIAELARLGKKAFVHGHLEALGRLMNENQEISQSLGGSNPEDDRFIALARKTGALGAKLAGSSGAIMVLHPEPEAMIATVREAGATDILRPAPKPGLEINFS